MLGNLTPPAAARTKSGREKLIVWLKHLENRSRQQPEATDPMATYDFAWLWREPATLCGGYAGVITFPASNWSSPRSGSYSAERSRSATSRARRDFWRAGTAALR